MPVLNPRWSPMITDIHFISLVNLLLPIMNFIRDRLALVALAGFSLMLIACAAVGPDYHQPGIQVPAKFHNDTADSLQATGIEIRWWEAFHDDTLNKLIAEGFRSNPDVRIATAKLQEARALRSESEFDLFPTVTTSASQKYLQRSQGIFGTRRPGFNLMNVGFDATWELDFFGRVRREIEAKTYEAEAFAAQRRDALVSLSAEIARNYFELRGTQHQLEVATKNAENQAATLKFTRSRLSGGLGTALDTARAEEQLNSTLATIPPLETHIRSAVHRIAVLQGQTPEKLYPLLKQQTTLPPVPNLVAIGNPAELLRRRPDIAYAERNLAATTAEIGVATADLFPRVTFNGNVALEAQSFAGLGASGGNTYSFGPSIQWAAFNLGRVYTRIKAAKANKEADLALYEKTVLQALEETENALVAFGQLQTRRDYYKEAVKSGEKASRLARLRYEDGVSDFLAVLDAERRLLETQDQLAQTETDTATAVVAVYKALGGGWEWEVEPNKALSK